MKMANRIGHSMAAVGLLVWAFIYPVHGQLNICGGATWIAALPVGPDGYWATAGYPFEDEATCEKELETAKARAAASHRVSPASPVDKAVCAREDDPRISPSARERLKAAERFPTRIDPKTGQHSVAVSVDYLETYGLIRHDDLNRPCPPGVTPPPDAQRPKQAPRMSVTLLPGMSVTIPKPQIPPTESASRGGAPSESQPHASTP